MAEIVGGGPPVNDSERAAIALLRDHGPDDWLVLHNIEILLRGSKYEVDLVVVTGHAVYVIDVKGTHGRVEVIGRRWYPSNRAPFYSPVAKLRGHARVLKGELQRRRSELSGIWVDALVVLTAPDAVLVDRSDALDADAVDVARLDDLIDRMKDTSRVRSGYARDIGALRTTIIEALQGTVQLPSGPARFGNWVVRERLGGTDDVIEYRAGNAVAESSQSVLLRVYRADPFQPERVRAAERIAIANAYEILVKLPADRSVVGCNDFFATEDEDQYVLVLDDVRGSALQLYLENPQSALAADRKLRILQDVLHGLAHAHAHRVIHRALTPSVVLVSGSGRAQLTGFDYARPEDPRSHTVAERLAEVVDPAYMAPECQSRVQAMSRASDVYAAGVIAYQLLTGELPFVSSSDQHAKGSALPPEPLERAGVPRQIRDLLSRMCALAPSDRPTAAESLVALSGAERGEPAPRRDNGYRNLPEGYQLTRKYSVLRRLGKPGAFGTAYQVYDNLAAADRVVKIVDRDRESVIERLRHEYQLLLGLPPHPNVIRVEGADYLDGGETPYLVFEYVDGHDVGELVAERLLGPADAVKLTLDAARGLVFLHTNGIYHCDIKPGNLLWADTGCKIIDFNVSVSAESTMSKIGGTSKYLPPDRNTAAPPTAADLADRDAYALGITFYQVLTGRWPFTGTAPRAGEQPLDPRTHGGLSDLSDALVQVVEQAIAPLRSQRFGSAAEFRDALEAIGGQVHRPLPSSSEPPGTEQPARNLNPYIDYLQTLYSQSGGSNAGTRGRDPHEYDLYVATALDTCLVDDVLAGKYRLVVITGNAGDGKTAFLEQLIASAVDRGAQPAEPRANGADVRLLDGRWLRTNHDGSQDEGDKANDGVLGEFFAPYQGPALPEAEPDAEIRLIAINEGRLVDFLTAHTEQFSGLADTVLTGLTGAETPDDLLVVNLNQRSVVAEPNDTDLSIFDRMLARMTHDQFWQACASCDLAQVCYAPHNAQTFAHPSGGPKITRRLRELYTLAHLRGQIHITLRDLRSALAYMLTSGRSCTQIHELYRDGDAEQILDGFYFNSWAGTSGTRDRLLSHLGDLDLAAVPAPALDRRLAYLEPTGGQAMMTIDQRGEYDLSLLGSMFDRLRSDDAVHDGYLASARRRFYFEAVDDRRAAGMLPYRSAERFLSWVAPGADLAARLSELIAAINRGEGLRDPDRLGNALALQVREVPGGTIRSYRLFPAAAFTLERSGADRSAYLEQEPDGLVLSYTGTAGHTARMRIQLDLFELLYRLRDGYLPGVAEEQGRFLELTIFKNELSSTPYQEVVLTTGGPDLHRIRRTPDGRLVMEELR